MNDKNATSIETTEAPGDCEEDLAALAKALSHPARDRILRLLASRKTCVCGELVSELPLAQSAVSEHLRILKVAGLVMGEVDGPRVCTASIQRLSAI